MDNTTHIPTSLWQRTKKVARFTWRHLLTMAFLMTYGVALVASVNVNGESFTVGMMICVFIDWLKCGKGQRLNNSHEQMLANVRTQSSTHVSNAMQPTLAWSSDPFAPGSPAYNIRQNRINGY